jgi:DNA-binding LacI/PurR family transcriptional regulator
MELIMSRTADSSDRRGVGVKDVAAVAGVSVGTVSNVLNHPEKVRPQTRERVRAVINHLGYVPNEAARQLRAGWTEVSPLDGPVSAESIPTEGILT